VVLSTVLFVLVAAIVVVLANRAGADRAKQPCLVGVWRMTDYREVVYLQALDNTVTFTGGAGTVLRLDKDGTGESDYGTGTSFYADTPDGRKIRLEMRGPVRFTYRLTSTGEAIELKPAGNEATSRLYLDGQPSGPETPYQDELTGKIYQVTCAGDTLTQEGSAMTVRYRRR